MEARYEGRRWVITHIIWKLMTGEFPTMVIDHIDGDRQNNRWSNLRHVSQSVNLQNKHGPQSNNKLGVQGVTKMGKKYIARIKTGGKQKHLGSFSTPEEAGAAYQAARLPI